MISEVRSALPPGQRSLTKDEVDHVASELASKLRPLCAEFAQKQRENNARIEEGKRLQAEGQRRLEKVAQEKQSIAQDKQKILIKVFYSIFHGKTPPAEKDFDAIFASYLADKSLSVEKNALNKSYIRLNSMTSVIRYLDDHPGIKVCDFRPLRTDIYDVATLVDYLGKSSIETVKIRSGISAADKALLDRAVAVRKGGLAVQFD
jgi:hypothetical protein